MAAGAVKASAELAGGPSLIVIWGLRRWAARTTVKTEARPATSGKRRRRSRSASLILATRTVPGRRSLDRLWASFPTACTAVALTLDGGFRPPLLARPEDHSGHLKPPRLLPPQGHGADFWLFCRLRIST